METHHVSLGDSPMVPEDPYGDCSQKPFSSNNHSSSGSRNFDDSVIEIIDSPAGKQDRSVIELMDSREDLKLELSSSTPTSKNRGSPEMKAGNQGTSNSPMSEILASNSLLYENVDNIDKVIDDDEDVQSMLAHQSADMMEDYDDSILPLFDKSTEINLLSPRKDLNNKSKGKDAWSPKKEIWSDKNEKKRKLREASLSPAPEESNKKKTGSKEEDEEHGQGYTKVTSRPQDLALDSGSESSRPGSSQHVESPDISCGSPIPGPQPPEGRHHDPTSRRTSTPGAKHPQLSTPQKMLRQQLRQEVEQDSRGVTVTPTQDQGFKAPTPLSSPGGGGGFVIEFPGTIPEDLQQELVAKYNASIRVHFPSQISESEKQEILNKHKAMMVAKDSELDFVKKSNKRLSDVSSLSKSSTGGSSGYLGESSSGITTSSSGGSRGRSRLSTMPETVIEKHSVIAKLPTRPPPMVAQEVVVVVGAEEVMVGAEEVVETLGLEEDVGAVGTGPNVAFVNDSNVGLIESQIREPDEEPDKNNTPVKKGRKTKEEPEKKVKEQPKKKKLVKVKVKKSLKKIPESEALVEEDPKVSEAPTDRFGVGEKVFAKWVDGSGVYFYPADVVERLEDKIRVNFNEDKIERVLAMESDVISVHHLRPGDGVTVKHDVLQAWEVTATLLNYPKSTATNVLYQLAITATDSEPQPNEDSRSVSHHELSLTDAQASTILRGRGLVPSTNKVAAEINLENLVCGPRKTRTPLKLEGPATPRRKRGGENIEDSATSTAVLEDSSSTSSEQHEPPARKKKYSTPAKMAKELKPATPTSARKKGVKGKRVLSSDDEEEEVMPKTSSRMQAVKAKEEVKAVKSKEEVKTVKSKEEVKSVKSKEGVKSVKSKEEVKAVKALEEAKFKEESVISTPKSMRSKKAKDIFEGISFVLTTSKQTLPMTEGEDDDEDFTDNEAPSINPKFEKKKFRDLIAANGGEVLSAFPSSASPASTLDKTLLVVSDRRCLTMTYLLALSDSVPVVSHIYILDCVASSSLLDRKAYHLPAGFSSLLMMEVEQGQDCSAELRANDCLLPVRGTRQRREEDPMLAGRRILSGLHVLVISLESDFTSDWQSVLTSLGAAVTARHAPAARLDKLRLPDVVVTDSQAQPAICKVGVTCSIPD